MVLQRRDPFRELRRLDEVADRFWRGFGIGRYTDSWRVPLDVVQEADNILVHVSVPGVKPEDIQVTIEEGLLTIKGETKTAHEERDGNYLIRERRSGRYHRTLRLPDTVDTDNAESRYEDGVLTVTLPKIEGKKAKRLEIKVGK